MCGRFSLHSHPVFLSEVFRVLLMPREGDWPGPRYNVAPTQPVAAIFDDRDAKQRRMAFMHWGLIPRWAKDPSIGQKMINARSETAAQKNAFKHAMRYRRCIIPADGFYEWKKMGGGKQPFFIRRPDHVLPLAGLYEHWFGPNGEEIDSCTILTTAANDALKGLHHRMPVVLSPNDVDRWLDHTTEKAEAVSDLLRPAPDEWFAIHPVSRAVNTPAEDHAKLIEPVDLQTGELGGGGESESDTEDESGQGTLF